MIRTVLGWILKPALSSEKYLIEPEPFFVDILDDLFIIFQYRIHVLFFIMIAICKLSPIIFFQNNNELIKNDVQIDLVYPIKSIALVVRNHFLNFRLSFSLHFVQLFFDFLAGKTAILEL